MTLRVLGQLPGSDLNLAANLALPPLQLALGDANNAVATIESQISGLVDVGGLDLSAFAANLESAASAILEIDFPDLFASASLNVQGEIDAIASLQADLEGLLATINVALGGSGVAAYRYTGDAAGFAQTLGRETNSGLPGGFPSDEVNALVLASSESDEWIRLAATIGPAGAPPDQSRRARSLEVLGEIPGIGLHVALTACVPAISTLISSLAAKFVTLFEFTFNPQLQIAPLDPLSVGIGLSAAIQSVFTLPSALGFSAQASASLNADLLVQAGIAAALSAPVATLEFGLGGSGVAAYHYQGPASELARELGAETNHGLVNCNAGRVVTALVLATGNPASWASLQAALRTY